MHPQDKDELPHRPETPRLLPSTVDRKSDRKWKLRTDWLPPIDPIAAMVTATNVMGRFLLGDGIETQQSYSSKLVDYPSSPSKPTFQSSLSPLDVIDAVGNGIAKRAFKLWNNKEINDIMRVEVSRKFILPRISQKPQPPELLASDSEDVYWQDLTSFDLIDPTYKGLQLKEGTIFKKTQRFMSKTLKP